MFYILSCPWQRLPELFRHHFDLRPCLIFEFRFFTYNKSTIVSIPLPKTWGKNPKFGQLDSKKALTTRVEIFKGITNMYCTTLKNIPRIEDIMTVYIQKFSPMAETTIPVYCPCVICTSPLLKRALISLSFSWLRWHVFHGVFFHYRVIGACPVTTDWTFIYELMWEQH